MKWARFYDVDGFRVDMFGYGTAYTFYNVTEGKSIHLQGEDAVAFRDELKAYEKAQPNRLYSSIFAEMWNALA